MAICEGKIWFESAKHAKRKARRLKSTTGVKLVEYKCPICGGYHLTSKTSMAYKITARRPKK